MNTRDFHYNLPEQLIAQKPCDIRSQSRLLHYSRKTENMSHHSFSDILSLINPGDLLVFNYTRVILARMHGLKETGGKVEILVERLTDTHQCLAHIKASKTPKPGNRIILSGAEGTQEFTISVIGRDGDLFILQTTAEQSMAMIMETIGHMPLPPYIERDDTVEDFSRYQTVYADEPGAVAAPTAGLHFDENLLMALSEKGINSAYVTLHVGAGTFQPVRCDSIEDHKMHFEYLEVPQETVDKCLQTRLDGGRVIAVGTTTVRSLETAYSNSKLKAYAGETDHFIYPGYEIKRNDAFR